MPGPRYRFSQIRLPSIPIARLTHCRADGFPYPDAMIIASGCEDGWISRMPCDAVDAAIVTFEAFDVAGGKVGAPNIYTRVYGNKL